MLLIVGLLTEPAYAEPDNTAVVGKYINSELHPAAPKTWDEVIAPQLAKRDAAVAEANRIAAEAEAKRVAEEAAALAAQQAAQQPTLPQPSQPVAAPSGSCADWMAQAGITDPGIAILIIQRESGCRPDAQNPSGACGIGQQLPCGKWPHAWNDPVGGMIDMQNYVMGRYGSWANAWAYWQAHQNY